MDEFNFEKDDVAYPSAKEWAWLTQLGFCGCYSDTLYDLVFGVLEQLYIRSNDQNDSYYYQYEEMPEVLTDLQELVLHVLDGKEITEHGSAVRGCWLTSKGQEICDIVFKE